MAQIVRETIAWTVPLALLGSAILIGVSPLVLAEGYSWLSMSISESGAQGVEHAWIARLGFLFFASAVLRLSVGARGEWASSAVTLHAIFGLSLVGVAVFSHRPWQIELPFSAVEDRIHSVFATVMGFAFAVGIVTRWIQRRERDRLTVGLDALAVFAATFVPIAASILTDFQGVLQRTMFAVAYVWYGHEAVKLHRASAAGPVLQA